MQKAKRTVEHQARRSARIGIGSGSGISRGLAAVACCWLMALGASASAQPEAPVNIVVPQSRVLTPREITPGVEVRSVEADIEIDGQIATTTVRITLANTTRRVQRAQLVMPVAHGAVIRFFQLEGLGDDSGARMLPREEARRIYEGIVRSMMDPALLEYLGTGAVQSDVFPVPVGGTQTIVLVYEQLLGLAGSRVDYALLRAESMLGGDASWTINAVVKNLPEGGAIHSPTHAIRIETIGGKRFVSVARPESSGHFRLVVIHPDAEGFAGTMLHYPDPDDAGSGYFMYIASVPHEPGGEKILREVTVVLDRSGSMRGEKIEQAKSSALQIIEALEDGEKFNIIDYSTDVERFSEAPVVKSAQSVEAARGYIESIRAIGGTNISGALTGALGQAPSRGMLPIVLFLTDGLPTVGTVRESALIALAQEANIHKRRIFSIGVGFDVNAPLLTTISGDSRATTEFVGPSEDVEVKVGRMFARLAGPVLAEPRLAIDAGRGTVRDIAPSRLGDVFEGEQLVIAGRYTGDPRSIGITLAGAAQAGERTFEMSFPVNGATRSGRHVARLWATRQIAALIDAIRRSGADGSSGGEHRELVDEIVRLSIEFGVLTEYTAFLADDVGVVGGRPVATSAEIRREIERNLDAARGARSGEIGVAQSMLNSERERAVAPSAPADGAMALYALGGELRADEVASLGAKLRSNVQQAGSDTLYFKMGRWVTADVVETPTVDPDETVEFASERYFELAGELAADGRQALLAQKGDVLLVHRAQKVLVRNPS